MSLIAKLPALGCGAAAAVLALACLENVGASSTSVSIHACASDDGTLRLTELTVPCKPGERRLRLRLPEIGEEPKCGDDDDRAAKLERRIKDLEYRHRSGTLRGRRVVAPFEVVTKAGRRLLHIVEERVTFHNTAGEPVVQIWADSGGWLLTKSTTAKMSAGIGAFEDGRAHVLIQENDRERIAVGRTTGGTYSLRVFGPSGKVVAGLGESRAGSGVIAVNGVDETRRVTMNVGNGMAGQIAVSNVKGMEVGALSGGASGAGRFQLTDSSGALVVEAGVNAEGRGVVRAGPVANCNSGVGLVGQVPSCIVGRAK